MWFHMKFSRFLESIECSALLSFHMHIVSWSNERMEDKMKDLHDRRAGYEDDHTVEMDVNRSSNSASRRHME